MSNCQPSSICAWFVFQLRSNAEMFHKSYCTQLKKLYKAYWQVSLVHHQPPPSFPCCNLEFFAKTHGIHRAVPSSNALRATRLGAGGTACAVAMGPISGNPQMDNPCGSPNLVACHSQSTCFFPGKSPIFLGQNLVVIGGSPGTKLSIRGYFFQVIHPGIFFASTEFPGARKGLKVPSRSSRTTQKMRRGRPGAASACPRLQMHQTGWIHHPKMRRKWLTKSRDVGNSPKISRIQLSKQVQK